MPPDDARYDAMMEAQGFDLLAQVEALARHVAEIQRQIASLRTRTATSDARSIIRARLTHLLAGCDGLAATVRDIQDAAAHPQVTERPVSG